MAADPFALPPRGRHLVARALRDDLALELRERQEDVQRQSPEGTRRVELLSHRHEADAVPVEDLDDSREVEQGPTEPVHLIYDDAVDLWDLRFYPLASLVFSVGSAGEE